MNQAIGKVDSMEHFRQHFVKSVQNTLQQYEFSSGELCETLAQLVLQQTDALGPSALHAAHAVFVFF
jgi:hypothetical protein